MLNKRGQVTIFIIIALLIIAVIGIFFIVRDRLVVTQIPESLDGVYQSFLLCLQEDTIDGLSILGTQAGYIEPPEFEPGSSYMPFSNQLDFLGNPVPYWYYVSGNNVPREQVPSVSDMEDELARFIENKIVTCDLSIYNQQGYRVIKGDTAKVVVNLKEDLVEVNLDMDLSIEGMEDKVFVRSHTMKVNSKILNLYNSAKKIYQKEQDESFLENYGIDILRNYAPVDGVQISCAPKLWVVNDVFDELKLAIESNTLALKSDRGNYDLKSKDSKYFLLDLGVDENVRFLNSRYWAYSYEVEPDEGQVLVADPIGNQQGLGAMGFCYVPYHFVYNMKYPVLIQLENSGEIFQFPVAVVIQGNQPRAPKIGAEAFDFGEDELCQYQNAEVKVNIYDKQFNSIDADVSYECFGAQCAIGKTDGGSLIGNFPQCVNGFVVAKSEGYEDAKVLYSSTDEGSVNVFMDKTYDLNFDLTLDGIPYTKSAVINFLSENDGRSKTILYPDQRVVGLSEGSYEISVYIYDESNIQLDATKTEKCVDVPQSGLGGFFGLTREKCYTIEMPAQVVSNALAGGGQQSYYILESQLQSASSIVIGAQSLSRPNNLDELQNNYILFETKGLEVTFR